MNEPLRKRFSFSPKRQKKMDGEILCVGEVLWDALPDGLFLGGAPLNVARHLHALGEEAVMVSRVGEDRLGREALRRLEARGMATDLVQTDAERETGFVEVTLDAEGTPNYEIVRPVAWDALALTNALSERAARAEAIVFGSLAQRSEASRRAVRGLCEAASGGGALKVFDVNLRPPHDARSVVEASLQVADVVKLNDHELERMRSWFGLVGTMREAVGALAERFDCRAVCITRGAEGSALWKVERWHEHSGYRVHVKDTVGAGDAFLAAMLSGLLAGHTGEKLLDLANRLGAYVATRSGAVPAYEIGDLEDIIRMALDGHEHAEPAS